MLKDLENILKNNYHVIVEKNQSNADYLLLKTATKNDIQFLNPYLINQMIQKDQTGNKQYISELPRQNWFECYKTISNQFETLNSNINILRYKAESLFILRNLKLENFFREKNKYINNDALKPEKYDSNALVNQEILKLAAILGHLIKKTLQAKNDLSVLSISELMLQYQKANHCYKILKLYIEIFDQKNRIESDIKNRNKIEYANFKNEYMNFNQLILNTHSEQTIYFSLYFEKAKKIKEDLDNMEHKQTVEKFIQKIYGDKVHLQLNADEVEIEFRNKESQEKFNQDFHIVTDALKVKLSQDQYKNLNNFIIVKNQFNELYTDLKLLENKIPKHHLDILMKKLNAIENQLFKMSQKNTKDLFELINILKKLINNTKDSLNIKNKELSKRKITSDFAVALEEISYYDKNDKFIISNIEYIFAMFGIVIGAAVGYGAQFLTTVISTSIALGTAATPLSIFFGACAVGYIGYQLGKWVATSSFSEIREKNKNFKTSIDFTKELRELVKQAYNPKSIIHFENQLKHSIHDIELIPANSQFKLFVTKKTSKETLKKYLEGFQLKFEEKNTNFEKNNHSSGYEFLLNHKNFASFKEKFSEDLHKKQILKLEFSEYFQKIRILYPHFHKTNKIPKVSHQLNNTILLLNRQSLKIILDLLKSNNINQKKFNIKINKLSDQRYEILFEYEVYKEIVSLLKQKSHRGELLKEFIAKEEYCVQSTAYIEEKNKSLFIFQINDRENFIEANKLFQKLEEIVVSPKIISWYARRAIAITSGQLNQLIDWLENNSNQHQPVQNYRLV